MAYNLTFIDNATLSGVVEGLNTSSNGWLAGLILITLWVVLLITFYDRVETDSLLIGTSFIMAIITGLMLAAGLIAGWVIIFPIIGIIGGILFKYMG